MIKKSIIVLISVHPAPSSLDLLKFLSMDAEEDVNHFRFGKLGGKDAPIDHLSNAHIALLLKRIRAQKQEEAPNQRLPE
jgi:hypothetical protein